MEHNEYTNVIEIKTYALEFALIQTTETHNQELITGQIKYLPLSVSICGKMRTAVPKFSCFWGLKKIGFFIQQKMILSQK
jgi:hypothetical protein